MFEGADTTDEEPAQGSLFVFIEDRCYPITNPAGWAYWATVPKHERAKICKSLARETKKVERRVMLHLRLNCFRLKLLELRLKTRCFLLTLRYKLLRYGLSVWR